jgi:DNA polymerase I-like protein with 3'-5' exonuclease and polymerase domains
MQEVLLTTEELLQNFEEQVLANWNDIDIVAFDLETDGVNERTAKIYGIGLAFQDEEGYYIPVRHNDGSDFFHTATLNRAIEFVKKLLANKKVIGHNVIYDTLVWEQNYGQYIADSIHADTILMKHMLDEERPFGLKEVAVKYLGAWADKAQKQLYDNIQANGGSITKTNLEMFKADTEVLGTYCAWDVLLTFKLYNLFSTKLKEEKLEDLFYAKEVMPLYKNVTVPMKRHGIPVDREYFKNLLKEIDIDIQSLKDGIIGWLETNLFPEFHEYSFKLLNDIAGIKKSGTFPRVLGRRLGLDIQSTAKKTIEKLRDTTTNPIQKEFINWLLSDNEDITLFVNKDEVLQAQLELFFEKKEQDHVFNLNSKDHLKHLFFSILKEEPLSETETGAPQVDEDFLESIKSEYAFVPMLLDLNKLNKIKGTYIEGILERQHNGIIYTTMLQFGTTSGRYSSTNPNLQNLPRPKEDDAGLSEMVLKYTNAIRKGFIAPAGYKFIDTDYSALEPRCFAHMSGSRDLQAIFHSGVDMYSAIAIQMFGLKDVSANKKDANFLGKVHPEKRQQVKAFCFVQDTKVEVESGVKNIQDVVVGDKIKTAHGFKAVTHTMQRESNTVNFITNRGAFVCTPDHKVWNKSKQDFVEAQNFVAGDEIEFTEFAHKEIGYQNLAVIPNAALRHGTSKTFSTLTFTEDWGYILGAFLGDGVGSFTRKKSNGKRGYNSTLISNYVGICGLPEDMVVKKWVGLVEQYGWRASTITDQRQKLKPFTVSKINEIEFCKLFQTSFKSFDINAGKKNLKIQDFVFNSPMQVKLAFIAGLLDTDGYLKHNQSKDTVDVAFCSKSLELSADLVTLLNTIGVSSSLNVSYNKTYNKNYYIVSIHKIGIIQLKKLGLAEHLACPRKKETINNASNEVIVRAKINKFTMTEDKGVNKVYDITVQDVHEFYANGIRVHNCLAVVYGAEAFRIAGLLNIKREEAQKLIDMYLNAFPDLKSYIESCHKDVNYKGYVTTIFGRVRHLQRGRDIYKLYGDKLLDSRWARKNQLNDLRREYKNLLNNSTNFRIQGLAGHIINRAAIRIASEFKQKNIDGWICLNIHDQLICAVKEEQIETGISIVRDAMQNIIKLDVPLIAEPATAYNMRDGH